MEFGGVRAGAGEGDGGWGIEEVGVDLVAEGVGEGEEVGGHFLGGLGGWVGEVSV